MPELDTYNVIQRYAQANNDPAAVQAYTLLKTRAERLALWRAVSLGLPDLQAAMDLTLGVSNKRTQVQRLDSMTEEERRKLYDAACKAAGIEIDPAAFTK